MMAHRKSLSHGRGVLVGALGAFAMLIASPAHAQHHARLSADLTDHLAAGSQGIDVIIDGDKATVGAIAARYNIRIRKQLTSGAVIRVNAGQLDALRQDPDVDHLSGDIKIRSIADVTAETVGADQVWAGSDEVPALTGAGVTVAVIDSGIDTRHNAFLERRVIATRDFTGGNGIDRYGHGTHVAGIIAGQSGRTSETSDYRGIAPGAYLVNLRVLGDDGSGYASDVVEAIDWAIEHRKDYNVRVINLSLGAPVLQPYRDDPLCEAVERAVKAGITVVAAAGNYGRTADGRSVYGAITSPGNSPHAITVGALDTHGTPQRSDDTVAPYSSKGPTRYDLIIKPDVAAPGSHIVAAESTSSYLSTTYPERHVAGAATDAYMQLSGTSMAAGVVSGGVALLLEQRSNLKPIEVKVMLQLTSGRVAESGLFDVGAGSINLAAAAIVGERRVPTLPATRIAGETAVSRGLITFNEHEEEAVFAESIVWSRRYHASSVVCSGAEGLQLLTGSGSSVWSGSIVWSSSIVWSGSIVWSSDSADSIVWSGAYSGQSIIWSGASTATSIVWSSGDDQSSIVWSSSLVADSGMSATSVRAESVAVAVPGEGATPTSN